MPAHIRLKSFLGFGRFRYMTGAQVLQHQDGLSYLRWAHHAGMVIDSEILFQIGLHPEQTHPKRIPITPELIAEAQAHEDQLNGVTQDEKANRTNVEPCKPCSRCGDTCSLRNVHEPTSGSDGDFWALYI